MSKHHNRKTAKAHAKLVQAQKPLTIMDVDAAYRRGLEHGYKEGIAAGFKESSMTMIQRTYSAIACAAHELYGFGQERGTRLLNRMHEVLVETLTNEELAQRMLEEVGIEINWENPEAMAQKKKPIRETGLTKRKQEKQYEQADNG